MAIRFEKLSVENKLLNPLKSFELDTKIVEVRIDPLTGHTSRIVDRFGGQPRTKPDISELVEKTRNCFFCAGKVENVTPKILPAISNDERISVGEALLFPNLTAYSAYNGVCIFSREHFIDLADLTPEMIANNLKAHRKYIELIAAYDPSAEYCSINGNYLPPAGSSMIHPHSQCSIDALPTNQELELIVASDDYFEENGRSFWEDLIQTEKDAGERFVADLGRVTWLTSFAPIGFNEVRAIVSERARIIDLLDEDIEFLGRGISNVLRYYSDRNINSFNLAIYSGPLHSNSDHFRVNLRLVARSSFEPWYRSDATYFERLHWEPVTDTKPESLCAELRQYFK